MNSFFEIKMISILKNNFYLLSFILFFFMFIQSLSDVIRFKRSKDSKEEEKKYN